MILGPSHDERGWRQKIKSYCSLCIARCGSIAIGLANLMIEYGRYDRNFVRDWSNGPLLVRTDTGRLMIERDLTNSGSERRYLAWDTAANSLVVYDPTAGRYGHAGANLALEGKFQIATASGTVQCRPTFALYAELCRRYPPEVVEATCWIARKQSGTSCPTDLGFPADSLLCMEWS
jgi:anaerobic selenocysteine-containing dehydrogenase